MEKVKVFSIHIMLCMICILVLFLITSVIFANTSINDAYLDYFVYGAIGLSVFVFSMLANRKLKSKGILYGALFGALILGIIFLISGLFFASMNFSLYTALYMGVAMIAGILGGIIGVNLS